MSNNPYSVLGISPGASEEEVRTAYRELVRKYHPDQFQDKRAKELAEEKRHVISHGKTLQLTDAISDHFAKPAIYRLVQSEVAHQKIGFFRSHVSEHDLYFPSI
jgi:hypothetical protein